MATRCEQNRQSELEERQVTIQMIKSIFRSSQSTESVAEGTVARVSRDAGSSDAALRTLLLTASTGTTTFRE
jgi:hypothetical protein